METGAAVEILYRLRHKDDPLSQVAALRWRALFNRAKTTQINFRVLYEALRNLEERWQRDLLSPAEVRHKFFV